MAHPWCGTCFCFRDVRRAIVAVGMLTGVCSFVQILVTISVFTAVDNEGEVSHSDPEGDTNRLYIALACFDFIMIIASFLLVYGNERSNGMSRCYTLPWLILLPFYLMYEAGTNIFYFYHQFNEGRHYDGPLAEGHHVGFVVVPLAYWITKAIILCISFFFLLCHLHQVNPSPQMNYVRQVESFHEYDSAPPFPHPPPMMALPPAPSMTRHSAVMSMPPAPSFPRSSPLQCTSCSGGCSADRCHKCDRPQPLYSYAGMQAGNAGMMMGNAGNCGRGVESKGWTTSMFNTGR